MIRAEAIATIVKNKRDIYVWQLASAWTKHFLLFERYMFYAHFSHGLGRWANASNSKGV